MNIDGDAVLVGGLAIGFLYGVPALTLALSARTNRVAAVVVILWSIFPAAAELLAMALIRNETPILVYIALPTLALDAVAISRFFRGRAPASGAAGPTAAASPMRHIVPAWVGISFAHALYVFAAGSITSAVHLSGREGQLLATVTSGLGWLLVGVLEWLALRPAKVEQLWIGATFAAGTLAHYAAGAVHEVLGVRIYLLSAALTGLALACAQWACLPKEYPRRNIWLLPLPLLSFVSAAGWSLLISAQGYSLVRAYSMGIGLVMAAICGAVMQHILAVRVERPAPVLEPAGGETTT